MKRHLTTLLIILAAMLGAGCTKAEPEEKLKDWTMTLEPYEIHEGDTCRVTITSPVGEPVTVFVNRIDSFPEGDYMPDNFGVSAFEGLNMLHGTRSYLKTLTYSHTETFVVPAGTIKETHEGELKLSLVNMGDYYTGKNGGGVRTFNLRYKLCRD